MFFSNATDQNLFESIAVTFAKLDTLTLMLFFSGWGFSIFWRAYRYKLLGSESSRLRPHHKIK